MASIPMAYYDLQEAFTQYGCALCQLTLRDSRHYIDALLYEFVNDPDVHQHLRASLGLCQTHSWQLLNFKGNALGIAILNRVVISAALSTIDQKKPTSKRRWLSGRSFNQVIIDALSPAEPCLVCAAQQKSERNHARVFARSLKEVTFRRAFQQSDGLCLPHLRLVLGEILDEEVIQTIIQIQISIWRRLRDELLLFQDKNSGNNTEAMGAEGDSWIRAIAHIVGLRP